MPTFGFLFAFVMLAAGCAKPDARLDAKSQSAAPVAATVASERADSIVRQLAIGPDSFTVHLDSSMRGGEWSVDTLRILDARGHTAFAETLLVRGQAPEDFADASITRLANPDGALIGAILAYGVYPSAPGTGEGFRVLAVQSGGLVALTPRIAESGTPWVSSRSRNLSTRQLMAGNQFELSQELGYFEAIVPMALDLACRPNAPQCFSFAGHDSIAGLARIAVLAHFEPIEERSSIDLCERPDGASCATVDVAPGDSVEAMGGAAQLVIQRGAEWGVGINHAWLQIRLHGRTGWIHKEKDFTAIGLPPGGLAPHSMGTAHR